MEPSLKTADFYVEKRVREDKIRPKLLLYGLISTTISWHSDFNTNVKNINYDLIKRETAVLFWSFITSTTYMLYSTWRKRLSKIYSIIQ
jgi:hypothetical protein